MGFWNKLKFSCKHFSFSQNTYIMPEVDTSKKYMSKNIRCNILVVG